MLARFNDIWHDVPTVWIDTETTGIQIGRDRACQIGFARFEGGKVVRELNYLVDPMIPIPSAASDIHGITDEMVAGCPTIGEVFGKPEVINILNGAQPGAFNYGFDRQFVPPFCEPWDWPWLDALHLIQKHDRYASGKGRHKLSACCLRHGVALPKPHDAGSDARAAGELFYLIGQKEFPRNYTLGKTLGWLKMTAAKNWLDHYQWRANQPPMDPKLG